MNWSSLLPTTWNPREAYSRLSSGDPHGFRDLVIIASCVFAGIFAVVVLWQTVTSWLRVQKYLRQLRGDELALNAVQNVNLPCFREMRHHLIDFPSRDGFGKISKRRTVDAVDVFRESALSPAFSSSRPVLAIPSILIGLGVLGTFVGLQLGIGSLDLKHPANLDKSIVPLIEGCAVAFSSSVSCLADNDNFAWMHHLAPHTAMRDSAVSKREAKPQVVSKAKDNMAGFVLVNGSLSSNQSGEGEIWIN